MKSIKTKDKNEILLRETNFAVKKMEQISFSDFIKEKRKLETSPSGKKYLSTRELAERLDIDYEQFRKILNMNKPTKKRDCIIAICAALRLDHQETDEALNLYQYQPVLSSKNPRDCLLIHILDKQLFNPLTISEINNCLVRNGYPELDIIDHRPSVKPASENNNSPFKLLKKQTKTFSDDLILGDPYDSLDSEYSLYRYRCIAEMWLNDIKKKRVYHLIAGTHHDYHMDIHGKYLYDIKSYKSPEESGVFQDYFLELESMANRELKNMYDILNDTKNYQTRISAGIRNDAFYVYAETYNYTVPELDEYYLFEYQDGTPLLSVYKRSEFMRCYLSSDDYSLTYGINSNTLLAQYSSIDELETCKEPDTSEYLLKCRSRYFKRLIEQADTLIADIKSEKRYIRRLDYIYEDRDRVCQYFEVEKEFDCFLDGEYGDIMFAGMKDADFHFEDCGTVHITLEDLYKAFELGFTNINEICRIKKKLGSIEKIIK